MMAFIRTLIIAVSIFVLSHEADAVVSDMFEDATGTEMRVVPIAQSISAQQAQEDYYAAYEEVNVMPAYTKTAKVARVKTTIKKVFKAVTSFGGTFSAGSHTQIPTNISPAKL